LLLHRRLLPLLLILYTYGHIFIYSFCSRPYIYSLASLMRN
jgi:hypothetical protein